MVVWAFGGLQCRSYLGGLKAGEPSQGCSQAALPFVGERN